MAVLYTWTRTYLAVGVYVLRLTLIIALTSNGALCHVGGHRIMLIITCFRSYSFSLLM